MESDRSCMDLGKPSSMIMDLVTNTLTTFRLFPVFFFPAFHVCFFHFHVIYSESQTGPLIQRRPVLFRSVGYNELLRFFVKSTNWRGSSTKLRVYIRYIALCQYTYIYICIYVPGTPNNQKHMVVPIWQLKSFTWKWLFRETSFSFWLFGVPGIGVFDWSLK